MHDDPPDSRSDAIPIGECPVPADVDETRGPADAEAVPRSAAETIDDVLRRGGSRCIRVRGTFPQQLIVAGTADQIRRLLDEPEL